MLIRQYSITGIVQLCISWLIGSMSTSFIIWILTLFFSFSKKLIFAIIVFQIMFCFLVIIVFRDKPEQLNVNFEKHYKLFIILIAVSVFSIIYLNSVYYDFPKSFPASASEIFDIEMSFISSFKFGINRFPRFSDTLRFIKNCKQHTKLAREQDINYESNKIVFNNVLHNSCKFDIKNAHNPFYYYFRPLFFSDPLRNGKTFILPTLPLIYLASLDILGLLYQEASVIVCFLNTVSTVVGIFFLSHFFLTKIDIVVVILFLFSSGNSFFHFLTLKNINNNTDYSFTEYDDFDLIHNFGRGREAPVYSPILNLLSFSKHSSFAIPLALFTMAFAHPQAVKKPTTYIFAGILFMLNPDPAVSLSLFITLLFFSNSIKYIIPFAISLIPKFIIFNDNYNIDNNFFNIIENNTIYYSGNNFVKNTSSKFNETISFLIKYKPLWKEYQLQGIFYSPFWACFDSFGILIFFLLIWPFALYMINAPIFTQRFIASFSSFIVLSQVRIGNDYYENSVAITAVFLPYLIFLFVRLFDKLESFFNGGYSSDINQTIYGKTNIPENKNSFLKTISGFFSNGHNRKSKQIIGILISLKYLIAIIFILGTFCSAYIVSGFTIDQFNPINFYNMYYNKNSNKYKNEFQNEGNSCNLTRPNHLFEVRYDDFSFARFLLNSKIHPRTPIFCNVRLFNPIAAFAGRPVFMSDFHELWRRGADISEELAIVKLIKKTNDRFTVMKDLGYKYLFELMDDPFIVVNSSVFNLFKVLYTDEKYIFLKIRDNS